MPKTALTLAGVVVAATAIVAAVAWSRLAGSQIFISQKVCQVTGEVDKQSGQSTRNTGKRFGITGSDLGYPVPYLDRLLFIFGDTRSNDPDVFSPDDPGYDSLAEGPLRADVERDGCVTLNFFTEQPGTFRAVQFAAQGQQPRKLGRFEVPAAGFANGPVLFAFFHLRDHAPGCRRIDDGCALGEPQPGGQTRLGRSTDGGRTFDDVALVSKAKFQFAVPVVAEAKDVPGLPSHFTGPVVLIWASGKEDYMFRHSYPFFAAAPLSTVGSMSSWRYFRRLGADGKPDWREHEEEALPVPPFGDPLHDRDPNFGPGYHQCLGEFSAGWVEDWHKWMMLYACGGGPDYNRNNVRGIHLRISDTPWGPWSEPRVIFLPGEAYCKFMHSKNPCPAGSPNPGDDSSQELDADNRPRGEQVWGGEYAPILIPSYTKVDGDTTSLYWLLSTWNPYQVVLMRTRARPLRFSDIVSSVDSARGLWRHLFLDP